MEELLHNYLYKGLSFECFRNALFNDFNDYSPPPKVLPLFSDLMIIVDNTDNVAKGNKQIFFRKEFVFDDKKVMKVANALYKLLQKAKDN